MPYAGMAPPGMAPPGYFLPAPPPTSPGGALLADFGTRLLAYLIDIVLLAVVNLVIVVPAFFLVSSQFFAIAPDQGTADDPGLFFAAAFLPMIGFEVGAVVVGLALSYLYTVELMYRSGQTLGKRVMKIRVVPLDPRLGLTRVMALKRWATEFLPSTFVGAYALIDGLWQLWDRPFQQTLHDKAAQTVVVKVSA
jgi:uncharacterized RDD family membrane protein YckC